MASQVGSSPELAGDEPDGLLLPETADAVYDILSEGWKEDHALIEELSGIDEQVVMEAVGCWLALEVAQVSSCGRRYRIKPSILARSRAAF